MVRVWMERKKHDETHGSVHVEFNQDNMRTKSICEIKWDTIEAVDYQKRAPSCACGQDL